ncbi:MAG: hypothetical protein M3209_03115 [Acidobacteriota bacterium]|nr:hypothetical protein [Acidobacteriota bacterium]
MKITIAAFIFVLSCAAFAPAQEARTTTLTRETNARVATEIVAASSTKVVKGAPFSAEAISESVQTLADGNKIKRSVTTKLYRDGEGRFRREETANSGANSLAENGAHQSISIFDPVAGARYVLNPTAKTAHRFGVPNKNVEGAVIVNGQAMSEARRVQVETTAATAAGKAPTVVMPGLSATTNGRGKTESLGVREFEGFKAEGTRTVTTIPAGAIGNEQPIEMVYERWYSKDLEMIVYSKRSDPRLGEQTYRLTNISRSEPDRSLFTLPADYKVLAERTVYPTRKQ